MLAGQLKLVFWFLSLSLQLSAILSRRENDKNNGIVMTLHHMRSEEGFVRRDDDGAYERLAKMVQASKERASALKRGMPISRAGSLYAHSETIEYYIKLSVGTPPQDLLIIMDTGSDVVWLPCTRNYTCNKCPQYSRVFLPRKSSSAVPVKCADPKCKDLCQNQSCVGSLQNCPEYELQYGTGTARGRLLSETLTLPLEDGGKQEIKHFGVGCSVVSSIISGIAGFGKGGLSMPSQLSPLIGDRFAYCLQSHRLFDDKNKSSRMMMGNKAVPKDISLHYTPFLNNSRAPSFPYSIYYYIGLTGISIGGKRLKLPSNLLRFDAQGNGGTIIDSGASVSLFPNSIYYQIVEEFASQIRYRRTREIEAVTCFGLCYNVSGVENIQFPEFVFHFKGGSDMVMPSENTFIACDSRTYCLAMTNTGTRTSNLNEELGQVDTILSDKTGTLTCNSMEFLKCSIAGTAYGRGMTEVERAMAQRLGKDAAELQEFSLEDDDINDQVGTEMERKPRVKGFNFRDKRLMDGHWQQEPHPEVIRTFFRILAICQTAIPEEDEETGKISYEAESPDEAAFVVAARELGFEFFKRIQTSVKLHEPGPNPDKKVEREYRILNVLEFNSARKRMSVIVKDEKDQLFLLCKGADSVIFERLSKKDGREFEDATRTHISKYADAGLRTLAIAYRKLDEEEYNVWNEEFMEAKNTVSADRDEKVDAVTDKIERELILVGATAVEDKLQKGVPQCIDKLAQAGIKIWVLTGDKLETAINIGFACSFLRQGMKQILITLDTPEINAIEAQGNKEAISKVSRESIQKQISEGQRQVSLVRGNDDVFALIIDGKSLAYALEEEIKGMFLSVAIDCASVICCRVSPKQKALVTRLVKEGTGKTTLAIGDGANDVGMLQEADIGVGISGVEGMQAVMASDFAIAQFCFLERLLLVHGHWCYRRIATMICYFFYKNITFGFTLFYFEAYASFSGQAGYNDWYMSLFNVFFTSLPVIALGVFDQDVSARFCLQFPRLYQEGPQNILFRWARIFGWMFNGICSSTIIFFFSISILKHQAFRQGGQVSGVEVLGATMYTCIVWTVNCQIALAISYFTWIQHLFIWGSIAFWYLFLFVYGSITPTISTTAYKVLVEACGPSPIYWFITLVVVIFTLVPYFTYTAFERRFFPSYHSLIQWARHEGTYKDPALQNISVRRNHVGFTARVEAGIQHFKNKIHHSHNGDRVRGFRNGSQ